MNSGCSRKTIQRIFDQHFEIEEVFYNENLVPRPSYFVVDVSWFGKELAVLMIKACCYKKVIYAKIIDKECIEEYAIGTDFIEKNEYLTRDEKDLYIEIMKNHYEKLKGIGKEHI